MAELYVFDTSVLLRASFSAKSNSFLAFKKAAEKGLIVCSDETLDELETKLFSLKFDRYAPTTRRRFFLDSFIKFALNIPKVTPIQACRDPKDDKFLALAVAVSANSLITLDNDLLTMHPFRGVPIITPNEFLKQNP